MAALDAWPALPYAEWAPTKRTLHLVSQMVGKTRLALSPAQPEWLNACLYLDARGLTTGAMPRGIGVVTVAIDVFDAEIRAELSDGRRARVPIGPDRTIASIWADYLAALVSLGIEVDLWDKPQEMADTTPFAEDTRTLAFDPDLAQRFHRVVCAVDGAFQTFRSSFFGRTGIQFWWGSFDHCVLLFTGRRVPAPQDRGHILRYDLDAEHLNAGFWPGDEITPEPRLYAYIVPRPPGCETAPVEPEPADWVEAMGEWVLPYEQVRSSERPGATIVGFLQSVYRVAVTNGGWDAAAYRYIPPAVPHRAGPRPRPRPGQPSEGGGPAAS